jgi:hypothetical protein
MPRSKKRGGQKKHNKRLQIRNDKNYAIRKKVQQQMTDIFNQTMENLKSEKSGITENQATAD